MSFMLISRNVYDVYETSGEYSELANAIVDQAITDYRRARNFVLKHIDEFPIERVHELMVSAVEREKTEHRNYISRNRRKWRNYSFKMTPDEAMAFKIDSCYSIMEEIEAFFKSNWFHSIIDMDGKDLLNHLRNEPYEKEVRR